MFYIQRPIHVMSHTMSCMSKTAVKTSKINTNQPQSSGPLVRLVSRPLPLRQHHRVRDQILDLGRRQVQLALVPVKVLVHHIHHDERQVGDVWPEHGDFDSRIGISAIVDTPRSPWLLDLGAVRVGVPNGCSV